MKEDSKNIELIYLKDELVGFYNGKNKDYNTFEIGNICVKPEYQNKGIGTAVLKIMNKKQKRLETYLEMNLYKYYNEEQYQKILNEKYNVNNIFKNKEIITNVEEEENE